MRKVLAFCLLSLTVVLSTSTPASAESLRSVINRVTTDLGLHTYDPNFYSPYYRYNNFSAYQGYNYYSVAPDTGYIWGQSRDGGYFEASGRVPFNVNGNDLWRYGGRFLDGRRVPSGPVAVNSAGHVY